MRSIKEVAIEGKTLFMRVDFNVPMDQHQNITEDTRIRAVLPTLKYALDNNCKVVTTNQLYRERLGNKIGMNSWEMYKYSGDAKTSCPVHRTIESGAAVHADEIIINRFDIHRPVNVHTMPIYNR